MVSFRPSPSTRSPSDSPCPIKVIAINIGKSADCYQMCSHRALTEKGRILDQLKRE